MLLASAAAASFVPCSGVDTSARDGVNAAAMAGALAILGVAARAHNADHDRAGCRPASEVEIAGFERGCRDGRHDARFDRRHDSRACVGEAPETWGRTPRDSHVVRADRAGQDDVCGGVAAGRSRARIRVGSGRTGIPQAGATR